MYLFKPDEGVGEGRRLVVDSVDVTENPGYVYIILLGSINALAMLIFYDNLRESYDTLNTSHTVHGNVRKQPEKILRFHIFHPYMHACKLRIFSSRERSSLMYDDS